MFRISSVSRFRIIWRDLGGIRFWGAWTKNFAVGSVFKRCRKDRAVREVLYCFRQTFLRPKRTLLLSATAACKARDEERTGSCDEDITDEELKDLIDELDFVADLAKKTIFCLLCGKRLVLEKRQSGITYCGCKQPLLSTEAPEGDWEPYMEAEDVIIWRKEYKRGKGLFAYKVYGRFKEVIAQDFAAVQVDAPYRRAWDDAVASLSVVEDDANGVNGQALLHWEVLWPRLFANRDYVYLRRHKDFDVKSRSTHDITKSLPQEIICFDEKKPTIEKEERENVHTRAKRLFMEQERAEKQDGEDVSDNKIFIIISRSCISNKVPETKHAIRVLEYWSHMVIRSVEGPEKPGMEFVLTYYDEPAVGGMPPGVSAWATGRAAPAFLAKMRRAALDYRTYLATSGNRDVPVFSHPKSPEKVCYDGDKDRKMTVYNEQDMESSKLGPDIEEDNEKPEHEKDIDENVPTHEKTIVPKNDKADDKIDNKNEKLSENEIVIVYTSAENKVVEVQSTENVQESKSSDEVKNEQTNRQEEDGDNNENVEAEESRGSWYRYLYPFYYFV